MTKSLLCSSLLFLILSLLTIPSAYSKPALVISDVEISKVGLRSVTITWKTNIRTRCQIEYGITTSYGTRTGYSKRLKFRHKVTVSRLKGHTGYHYRIVARDRTGATTRSEDFTFTTQEPSAPRAVVLTLPPTEETTESTGLLQGELTAGQSLQPTIDDPVVPQALSISVSPDAWKIGEVEAGTTTTMRELDKVTVINDGDTREDFTLSLVNPEGWVAGSHPGPESFVLNAAFSSGPENIIWDEQAHLVTTEPVISTQARFAGDQNGTGVLPGEGRNLFLQFKSPIQTKATDSESIRLIISCEASRN